VWGLQRRSGDAGGGEHPLQLGHHRSLATALQGAGCRFRVWAWGL